MVRILCEIAEFGAKVKTRPVHVAFDGSGAKAQDGRGLPYGKTVHMHEQEGFSLSAGKPFEGFLDPAPKQGIGAGLRLGIGPGRLRWDQL